MATRAIRGQSVASQWSGVVLFGGFDGRGVMATDVEDTAAFVELEAVAD